MTEPFGWWLCTSGMNAILTWYAVKKMILGLVALIGFLLAYRTSRTLS